MFHSGHTEYRRDVGWRRDAVYHRCKTQSDNREAEPFGEIIAGSHPEEGRNPWGEFYLIWRRVTSSL